MDSNLTHLNEKGDMFIVDISEKISTPREALAEGYIDLSVEAFDNVKDGNIKKGDLFAAARFAAINASKKTSELIPLCHLLSLSNIRIDIDLCNQKRAIKITALCKTNAQTGVEMEALTAVSIGLLTIYDMLKAIELNFSSFFRIAFFNNKFNSTFRKKGRQKRYPEERN